MVLISSVQAGRSQRCLLTKTQLISFKQFSSSSLSALIAGVCLRIFRLELNAHLSFIEQNNPPRANYSTSYTPMVRAMKFSFNFPMLTPQWQVSCFTLVYLVRYVLCSLYPSNWYRTVVAIANCILDAELPVSAVAHFETERAGSFIVE